MSFGIFCMFLICAFFVLFFVLAIRAEKKEQEMRLIRLSNGYALRANRTIESTYVPGEGRTLGHAYHVRHATPRAGIERANEHAWQAQHAQRGNAFVGALVFIAATCTIGIALGSIVADVSFLQTLSKLLAGA